MDREAEMLVEKRHTALVQQLLYSVISKQKEYSGGHDESIRAMLADAWDELRLKPTALSTQDLEQLSVQVNHYLARKSLTEDLAARYERMLMNPFFGRVDFRENEENAELEKIYIGLYSLKSPQGELMVHDWRAPVCSLYYDQMPGTVSYQSPMGEITGVMTLKRQFRMENGQLRYFVDTEVSIDDDMLLDILSGATSQHMRQIVSTIQKEQNEAIRYDNARVLCVIGGAGSGKTSVAMHRAAFLMYRQRNILNANRIAVLSPSLAFSEYVSGVLPELGEENIKSVTLQMIVEKVIGVKVEPPIVQTEKLLNESDTVRRESVRAKSGKEFLNYLNQFVDQFQSKGPKFQTLQLGQRVLASEGDLIRMYRNEFRLISPALRLIRINTVLESRLSGWEENLTRQYEEQLKKLYHGKELETATRMAVAQRLQPIRKQIREMLNIKPLDMYRQALAAMPQALTQAAAENAAQKKVWWEDAPGIAYLFLALGFAEPDKTIRHVLIDEAQDYSDIALKTISLYYPFAHITILGDPKQRTCPGMPPCNTNRWRICLGSPDAPVLNLTKCYRSTLPIVRLCNAILPEGDALNAFGREGELPEIRALSDENVADAVRRYKEKGLRSIAVITRGGADAARLATKIDGAFLLDGSEDDIKAEPGDVYVGCYHLMKGLEFDAAVVVWPNEKPTDGERRRLYTACSRALHALTLVVDNKLLTDMGIIL